VKPGAPLTWKELANRPAQVLINLMAVVAFASCVGHWL